MLNGPAEELTKTYNAQPALLTTSSMISSKLNRSWNYSRLYSWS